jgi:TRAP-type C4-dicarboxylate transport system substrate-binding protein
MKRRRWWSTLGSLAVVLAFALLCLPATGDAGQQKITWTFATNPGPAANTWSFYPYPRFQKLLEKNSGGRLVLDTKMGLFPVNEVVHAVIAGRADIGWERIPWVAGTFPQWDYALPFFWDNVFEYEAFLNDPRLIEIEPWMESGPRRRWPRWRISKGSRSGPPAWSPPWLCSFWAPRP